MRLTLMKCKLHRASVTQADLHYEGSIAIDSSLCLAIGLLPYERVDIYNVNNGARFSTYVIPGEKGQISVNGAAARLVSPGDRIIIVAYAELEEAEARKHQPKVALLDEKNRIHSLHLSSGRKIDLEEIDPRVPASYIEPMGRDVAQPG